MRVHAAGVGGGEPLVRSGRMRRVMRLRLPTGAGNEYAGEIERTGAGVERLQPGDRVWGVMPHLTFGAVADYVAVPENLVGVMPDGLDAVSAAALPTSGTTMLTALIDKAVLRSGERLLVRGASGGLGSLAVQFGKSVGAHVTALASARNLQWVRELGADAVFDYRTTDPAGMGPFDVIFDTVGRDMPNYRRMVTRQGGRFIALAFDTEHTVASSLFVGLGAIARRRKVLSFSNSPTVRELDLLRDKVEAGYIRPVVDSVLKFDPLDEVHRRLEAGGVRGKYVIDMERS
ncbi:NAD(P)-dependent alcohol dehydrogenase [Streptomyces sp. MMS24-I2-30]|uniref:NAD(P)-dependent alcohol dehydrogenase n=1 Tax=Streptomyces sp. MMS24-I2-30 TaxID=3351564 RepID=UPI003896E0A2